MPIHAVISSDKKKLEKQIQALKYQLEQDINDKDKKIHSQALAVLELTLENSYMRSL
ncbi:hypothetical protein [Neobacillus mesonae]|uniref:hypothetical protein n=1 Tax=Neobacillus mesonae TaxID=1193713 RepID=UPI002040DF33|nr:hypothetical protein [Neobacillus mesonae]MCM3567572.1 hypothetical protein [Neobacillus mesonae]